ncbi:hypothetical protein ABH19_02435 [Leptospirillum sp. Group II 'CF-1']|nr:hypothetical protein ABH19_02435 [Leptospirillum sp. Group II 'CF-1']
MVPVCPEKPEPAGRIVQETFKGAVPVDRDFLFQKFFPGGCGSRRRRSGGRIAAAEKSGTARHPHSAYSSHHAGSTGRGSGNSHLPGLTDRHEKSGRSCDLGGDVLNADRFFRHQENALFEDFREAFGAEVQADMFGSKEMDAIS